MKTIQVPASAPYKVEVGSGELSFLGERISELCPKARQVILVSDDIVFPLYGERTLSVLRDAGFEADAFIIPHGEASKTPENLLLLLKYMSDRGLTRADALAALGGGMIGDIAGFAAAVYMRGIAYVQLPTTLLASVDSSVGGKTAVDLPAGKNQIGAFWQPVAVLCDIDLLDTLPADVFTDGCAEVIKTAMLFDPPLFALLGRERKGFDREDVISRCVMHKRDVVAEDEFDKGMRGLLNLGHTIGHAIETISNYTVSHGQAVAAGTAIVCRAAAHDGFCDPWLPRELESVLCSFGLSTETDLSIDKLMPVLLSDKKRAGEQISVVVPRRVGLCELVPMDEPRLRSFFEAGLHP